MSPTKVNVHKPNRDQRLAAEAARVTRVVAPIRPGQLACSPRQAAAALGIAQSTAWAWIRDGRLASRRVAGRRLVVVESVKALIAADGE